MTDKALLPITQPLARDAEILIEAINTRTEELKRFNDSQSLIKRVLTATLPIFSLAAGLVTIASISTAVIMFTVTVMPLTIAGVSLSIALTCLALNVLLSPTSTGESNIRNQWKDLFAALRQGNGTLIVNTCQELAKQKDSRKESFSRCLGPLAADEATPFFHKTCFVGYILIAFELLLRGESEQASTQIQKALSHFDGSHFSAEVKTFAKILMDSPQELQADIEMFPFSEHPLHTLDCILVKHHRNPEIEI